MKSKREWRAVQKGTDEETKENERSPLSAFVNHLEGVALMPVMLRRNVTTTEFFADHHFDSEDGDFFPSMLLVLPEGFEWMCAPSVPKMFVRRCYRMLYDLIIVRIGANSYRSFSGGLPLRVLVTGTRGTGITMFMNYMLYQLYHRRPVSPTIVLDIKGHFALIRSDQPTQEGTRGQSFWRELAQPSTIYLYDAPEFSKWNNSGPLYGPQVKAATIMTSSPNYDHFRTFVTGDAKVFCMPLWTLDELEACRRSCYPHVAPQVMCRVFNKWGGTIRYPLMEPESKTEVAMRPMLQQMTLVDAKTMTQQFGMYSSSAWKRLGALLHIAPVEGTEFQQVDVKFCSDYVMRKVMERNAVDASNQSSWT
uniref:Uncharacterized protein n=1 Tax=Globisporangium ultimum (strain ATCC 200006 / CBS 805.95 / DAOM BR144) TaxID=431595 RepID=K3WWD4_GLOUD